MIGGVIRKLTVAVVLAALTLVAPAAIPGAAAPILPVASAAPCPQVELIFARGRIESPGAGQIGNALVGAMRDKTDKDIDLYAVKYPADTEVDIGANDMSQRIAYMTANCPDTR
ncbi:MAG: cutinase family protein, partial [Mycobacterium sp.]|nr:cutinase family protein [Mycobacterium sp.]